ncbi:MAG: hypothetical protein IJ770_01750 [Alphaproteobacteria bacterium]|nr:hypothetical protein [Alphaproteobacteria bacterium]
MTVGVKDISVTDKLKEIKKRVLPQCPPLPMTNIDNNMAAHIVYTQNADNKKLKNYAVKMKFADVFDIIRQNFKNYTTKAAHHLNSRFIQPDAEQELIDLHYKGDEKLHRLMLYLDIALKDFEKNVARFMPNTENTDYKLDISVSGMDKSDIRIGFKNAEGKQIGPFLSTHVTTSPLDRYDMLTVNIGYIDKHKQPILTHTFSYDVLENADIMAEQRGDKSYLKTTEQIRHDKFKDMSVKANKERLRSKRNSLEI